MRENALLLTASQSALLAIKAETSEILLVALTTENIATPQIAVAQEPAAIMKMKNRSLSERQ